MIAIIIQARVGSTRLPRKVLMPVPKESNVSMLARVIRRCKKSKLADAIIVATPDNECADIALQEGVLWSLHEPMANDCLEGFYIAATKYDANAIVRITADCPLVNGNDIDKMIESFNESNADLVYNHNDLMTSNPCEISGLDVEVFSRLALERAYNESTEPKDREHVTQWIYRNCTISRVQSGWTPDVPHELQNQGVIELSVNTPEEYELACNIYKALGDDFDTFKLLHYIAGLKREGFGLWTMPPKF